LLCAFIVLAKNSAAQALRFSARKNVKNSPVEKAPARRQGFFTRFSGNW
jgi:hypothetical protein